MKHIDFIERKLYSYNELLCLFGQDREALNKTLQTAISKNIFKIKATTTRDDEIKENSYLLEYEETIEKANYSKNFYYTEYVGLIVVNSYVLKIYPKYFLTAEDFSNNSFKDVIKVLTKYNSLFQNSDIFNDISLPKKYREFAVEMSIMTDYLKEGIYEDNHRVIEKNGNGEILWDRTINDNIPYIVDKTPYYLETVTRRSYKNIRNYFKLLHEAIVTNCFSNFNKMGLLGVFSMPNIFISEKKISDFGNPSEILYNIENELNIQFSSRRKSILNLMYIYVAKQDSLYKVDEIGIYATRKFENIWEKALKDVLDTDYNKVLKTMLGSMNEKSHDFFEGATLDSIIDKPIWNISGKNISAETYVLDILKISKDKKILNIYDAKYYVPKISEDKSKITHQPGIQDISKQFFYELAYKKLIEKSYITEIRNYFLLPKTQDKNPEINISMEMFDRIGIGKINVLFLDPKKVFSAYLDNIIVEVKDLM